MVPARKHHRTSRAAECAPSLRGIERADGLSFRVKTVATQYYYRSHWFSPLELSEWPQSCGIFFLLAKISWRQCQYVHRQRTFALTPSQIKHISTCNEFHHNTDQFKTPPQTNRSRLQKCKQMSAVKQHKDETAASTFGYFGVTAWVNFLWNKRKAGGGVFCLTEHWWWRGLQHRAKFCLGKPISQGRHCVLEHLNLIWKARNSKPREQIFSPAEHLTKSILEGRIQPPESLQHDEGRSRNHSRTP